jgi:hypothetical protein
MKYLCLIYGDMQKLGAMSKDEMEALRKAGAPRFEELKKSGALVPGGGQQLGFHGLGPDHTSIRPGESAPMVTDGPFVESKEQVGGLFIIEARDLNEALRVASLHPAAHMGPGGIEVRHIPYWGG